MSEPLLQPELIWGLIPRFVGLLYIVAFAGLIPQLEAVVGTRGLAPIEPRLAAAKRDFPGLRRFLIFPSLLWLFHSDRVLRLLPWFGVLCGTLCVYGGPYAPFALGIGWLLWLSLEPAALIFPWDTMLQEVGLSGAVLADGGPLPHARRHRAAVSEPWPSCFAGSCCG